ncbi:MAG: hypothetical protein LH603_06590, partial [Pseudonocardia sp.]|nr:hypothetical protein [Pseudonocardia sp.]
ARLARRGRARTVSAFPPALPADVDDLSSIWANDWAAFRALNGMDTHWQRPGWTPGRRSYHWMLTFEDAQDVQSHVTACQRGLPADGLDLVEPAAVHLTLGRVGFTDELPLNSALAAAAAARQHTDGLAEFGLRIGPVSGARSGSASPRGRRCCGCTRHCSPRPVGCWARRV